MSARDKLTEYAASWIADCGESYDTADAHAAQLVAAFRAEVLLEAADVLDRRSQELGLDSGMTAGAGILRRMAATTPTSKEQQR